MGDNASYNDHLTSTDIKQPTIIETIKIKKCISQQLAVPSGLHCESIPRALWLI